MARYILKRKSFTKWDDTDNLKRMKDSDILAEEKKKQPGYGSVMSGSIGGAAVGGVLVLLPEVLVVLERKVLELQPPDQEQENLVNLVLLVVLSLLVEKL